MLLFHHRHHITYGDFGLRETVVIGNRTLAAYTYQDGTNNLISIDYGNTDDVKYTYDQQNRLTQESFYDNNSTSANATVKYLYDNDGALSKVIDSETGIPRHENHLRATSTTGRLSSIICSPVTTIPRLADLSIRMFTQLLGRVWQTIICLPIVKTPQ